MTGEKKKALTQLVLADRVKGNQIGIDLYFFSPLYQMIGEFNMKKFTLFCIMLGLLLSFVLPTWLKVTIVAIIGVLLFVLYDFWEYDKRSGGVINER